MKKEVSKKSDFILLPVHLNPNYKIFEENGFTLFPSKESDFFYKASLPKGWSLKQTINKGWYDLIDSKKRKRGNIFYECLDTSYAYLVQRYMMSINVRKEDGAMEVLVIDSDGNVVSYIGKGYSQSEKQKLQDSAYEYLESTYPNYENVNAYWD